MIRTHYRKRCRIDLVLAALLVASLLPDPVHAHSARAIAMTADERYALALALTWTGDLDGWIDETKPQTIEKAFRKYQTRNGIKRQSQAQARWELLHEANEIARSLDFQREADDRAGISVGLPRLCLGHDRILADGTERSGRCNGAVTVTTLRVHVELAQVYEKLRGTAVRNATKILADRVQQERFALATLGGDKRSFWYGIATTDGVKLLKITYTASDWTLMNRAVSVMANTFATSPRRLQTPVPPQAPRWKSTPGAIDGVVAAGEEIASVPATTFALASLPWDIRRRGQ